jgi:hypothetical protein
LKEAAAFIFYPEDGGNKFLRNAVNFLPGYMASHIKKTIIHFMLFYPLPCYFKCGIPFVLKPRRHILHKKEENMPLQFYFQAKKLLI